MKKISSKKLVIGIISLFIASATLLAIGYVTNVFDFKEEETLQSFEGKNLCELKSDEEYYKISRERWNQLRAPGSNGSNENANEYNIYTSYPLIFEIKACSAAFSNVEFKSSKFAYFENQLENEDANPPVTIDFVTAFYEDLGVDGLINMWGLSVSHYRDSENTEQRDFDDLQSYVSELLSMATDPTWNEILDRENSLNLGTEYVDEFIDLGVEEVSLLQYSRIAFLNNAPDVRGEWYDPSSDWEIESVGPTVYGWSVLAPLLREGEFHEDFLTPVATAVIEFDQEQNGDWRIDGEEELSFDMFDDDVTSSMDAVLEALSKNEVAAEEVYEATGDERVGELIS